MTDILPVCSWSSIWSPLVTSFVLQNEMNFILVNRLSYHYRQTNPFTHVSGGKLRGNVTLKQTTLSK